MTPLVQLHCIVCSTGSFRPFNDWVNKFNTSIGPLVACDGHTKEECQEALKRLKATVVGSVKAPAVTPATTQKPSETTKSAPGNGGTQANTQAAQTGTQAPATNGGTQDATKEQAKSAS